MDRKLFTKLLTLLLTLTLAFGPGIVVPTATVPAGQQSPAMQMMSGMDMSGATEGHSGCCPSSSKNQDSKGNMCASACAAMTQAALPFFHTVFLRQAIDLTYEQADTSAIGWLLPPDSPPPKA